MRCSLFVFVAACGGAGSIPAKATPTGGHGAANDCATLRKITDSPSQANPNTSGELVRGFETAAKSLRLATFVDADVRDLANALADHFQKVAANGVPLEKDFATLEASANGAKEKNSSFENFVVGIKATCDIQKSAAEDCAKLLKVLDTQPYLHRVDARDPAKFIPKLSAFRKALVAVPVNDNVQVKHMVSVADEGGAALEAALKELNAASVSVAEHARQAEEDGLVARMKHVCPKPAKP